jgi:spoIIIJ-associated protein
MTPGMEFEGKTVDHAVDEACKQFNLKKDDFKYDVLSYGSTGIFGLVGTKKARIRVRLPEKNRAKEAKETRRVADKDEPIEVSDNKEIKASDEGHNVPDNKEIKTSDEGHKVPDNKEIKASDEGHGDWDKDETIALCKDSLQTIVDAITDDAEISVEVNSERILFDVKGGNAGVLIGKRGQTLEAIQYIIEKVANKQNERHVRVHVDVEGYLKTRRENLEKLAARLAQKAVRTGKPMTIGQMNAHDRRIVHLSLKNNTEVRTQSLGEGLYRKLMIFPRKKGREHKSA